MAAGIKLKGDPTSIYHVSVSGGCWQARRDHIAEEIEERIPLLSTGYKARSYLEPVLFFGTGQIEKRVDSWPYPDGGNPTRFARVARVTPVGRTFTA